MGMKNESYEAHSGIIAREGLPFILFFLFFSISAFFLGSIGSGTVFLLVTAFIVWFFRNPKRITPEYEKLIISPADGKVLRIEDLPEKEFLKGPCKKISIFMNVFNVHVNRIPYSGHVELIRYKKGKFVSANLDKASTDNERNVIKIKGNDGNEILVIQIAGLIARRIVCWITQGMYVRKGDRFGLIRFGSCVELYLPVDCLVSVKIGDKVVAGETPIGCLK
jgi:phosphatidylserine decarboxylase